MARLRKPAALEPSAVLQQPNQARPRRSSPRKAVREVSYVIPSDDEENVPLRPKLSKHDFTELSSIFQDDTFFTATSNVNLSEIASTPRRQRTLRPIESNSRLLKKFEDESFVSSEKKTGSERRARLEMQGSPEAGEAIDRKRNLMYSRSLARSVAGRSPKKSSSNTDIHGHFNWKELKKAGRQQAKSVKSQNNVREDSLEPEEETSILCGDEADIAQEVEEQQVETSDDVSHTPDEQQVSSDRHDSEDDDVIFPIRRIKGRRPQRCVESSSESELEEELSAEGRDNIQPEKGPERKEWNPEEPKPLSSMRPPHWKEHGAILNWVPEVIDLTRSPQSSDSCVLPGPTRARSSSFAVSRPATSSSDGAQPFLT